VLQGIDIGISQEAQKGGGGEGGSAGVVWNFPVDVTFKTTNPHGWPRLVLSVFNSDVFGRHVIRGYGSVLVPTVPGSYTRYVRTFAPASSTYLQAFLGWATGNLPSFYDSKFVARNEGREVVRVRSTGVVRVQLCVVSRRRQARGRTRGRARALAPPASRPPRSYAPCFPTHPRPPPVRPSVSRRRRAEWPRTATQPAGRPTRPTSTSTPPSRRPRPPAAWAAAAAAAAAGAAPLA
jgi:B9 domain-containing protein 1